MIKIIRNVLIVLLSLLLIGFLLVKIASEPLPDGEEGKKAEDIAKKMMNSLNKEAYDSLKIIEWTFPGGHHYKWNKKLDIVEVKWDDFTVNLNTTTQDGSAYEGQTELNGPEKEKALKKAWGYFANDSFWFIAPFKIYDPGTSRKYVQTEEGDGLLITYSSGGVTPGDSYLWILDDNFRPVKWKMWVSIIPIGGVEITWGGWTEKQNAWFSTTHESAFPFTLKIEDIHVSH